MSLLDEPSVRIVSGPPAVAEHEINQLAGMYSPLVWNIAGVAGEIVVTCVMIHEREIRKMQIAMPQAAMGARR